MVLFSSQAVATSPHHKVLKMTKNIEFLNVTLCGDGSLMIKLDKQITDPDTGEVVYSQPHRTVVDFDGDVDVQIAAVEAHLASLGYSKVPNRVVNLIKKIDTAAKADARIEAVRQAKKAARLAAESEPQ